MSHWQAAYLRQVETLAREIFWGLFLYGYPLKCKYIYPYHCRVVDAIQRRQVRQRSIRRHIQRQDRRALMLFSQLSSTVAVQGCLEVLLEKA